MGKTRSNGVMEYWSNGEKRNGNVFKSQHSNIPTLQAFPTFQHSNIPTFQSFKEVNHGVKTC
jgi:hypothetical protein